MITGPQPLTVAGAVGLRVAEIRKLNRITRDALARAGSLYGVTWGRTSIENIEAGRFAPTLPTLYVLCTAISQLIPHGRIGILDLLPENGSLEIADGYAIGVNRLRRFLGDPQALVSVGDGLDEMLRAHTGPPPRPTLAEERAAARLSIDVSELRDLAFDLWVGESLDDIVTHSLEPNASPQARGHETRRRIEELRVELNRRRARG